VKNRFLEDGPLSASGETQSDVGIEQIRSLLVEIVKQGLLVRPDGVHLTYVGSQFGRRAGAPFEQYVTFVALQEKANIPPARRKMVPFIKEYCADLFDITEQPNGSVIIRERKAAEAPAEKDPQGATPFRIHNLTFKKSIWLAFIRPLKNGYRRFLNISERAGFTDISLAEVPPDDWKPVDQKFILGIPLNSPIDGQAVREMLGQWADESHIELEQLTEAEAGRENLLRPTLADLSRIVEALPSELATRWLIPAEILRHLRK
jgi:hypothetical protein